MSHPNEDLVRKAYAAYAASDLTTLRACFAPDVTWHSPGRHPLAGDHRGPDAVVRFLTGIGERTGGTFRLEVHDVLANDEHAVLLSRVHGERGGRSLHDNHALIFHVRDGLITECWGHARDQHAVDDLLS